MTKSSAARTNRGPALNRTALPVNWKSVFGEKLLGICIGMGVGALKGLRGALTDYPGVEEGLGNGRVV